MFAVVLNFNVIINLLTGTLTPDIAFWSSSSFSCSCVRLLSGLRKVLRLTGHPSRKNILPVYSRFSHLPTWRPPSHLRHSLSSYVCHAGWNWFIFLGKIVILRFNRTSQSILISIQILIRIARLCIVSPEGRCCWTVWVLNFNATSIPTWGDAGWCFLKDDSLIFSLWFYISYSNLCTRPNRCPERASDGGATSKGGCLISLLIGTLKLKYLFGGWQRSSTCWVSQRFIFI